MLNIGDVLEEKYRITGLLGKGGTGHVYLAENIRLGNEWAVKEVGLSGEVRADILEESEILRKLNHHSIPRIVDIIEHENFLYLIEDYFAGVNLKELIKAREACSEADVIRWAKQLCEILIYLHSIKPNPIIYRDMKPGNIIIDNENNAKLIDLGIAREYKEDQDSDTSYIGTRGYAAPEQYSGANQTDERTDVYGLGAALYHAVTGANPNEPPYRIVPVRQNNKSLSKDIERIIAKCTQNDPGLRYQNVNELLTDLNNMHRFNSAANAVGSTVYTSLPAKLVVIGSLSPRAGSSFITANLAAAVAARNVSSAVIESPVNFPYFYDALFIREKTNGSYVSRSHKIKDSHEIDRSDVFVENGISWIALDPTQFSIKNWTYDNMMKLIYSVKHTSIVLLDVSTFWVHSSVQPILGQADNIILVVDPDPVLLDRTMKIDYEGLGIGEECIPQESRTIELLKECKNRGSCDIDIIVNKYTGFVEKYQLCLPFNPLVYLPHIDPVEVYKAIWEGSLLYSNPDFKTIFDEGFSPIIEKLVPAKYFSFKHSIRGSFLERVKAAYKLLKGEDKGVSI